MSEQQSSTPFEGMTRWQLTRLPRHSPCHPSAFTTAWSVARGPPVEEPVWLSILILSRGAHAVREMTLANAPATNRSAAPCRASLIARQAGGSCADR
eukprot:scaffold11748_cov29-Tisochrysis_lutea.AAC.2